ncbi:hypothetical protein L1049_009380 [Liquidambar formosana]|uniref:Uncharacterized protein n=1 Tax=Liquidambar formosana TaxID=63359 RepID=A0AAP0S606_LIQFO
MLPAYHADANGSEKKMEGDDGLRTLECLRGRLQAERVASRVAKEDAELIGKKLIELENQLRVETKSKNRAEKKLKFLMKKLESLKITYVSEESEQSSSSENFGTSCISSSSSAGNKDPEEQKPKTQITNTEKCDIEEVVKETNSPTMSQNLNHGVSETSMTNQSHTSEETSSPPATSNSSTTPSRELESNRSCEDSKTDDHSSASSNSPMEVMGINGEKDNAGEDYGDNSLALVLVPESLQAPPRNGELKMVSGSVSDVLDALRHAREKLQSSLERRHMIKVGSTATKIC